MVLYNLPNSYWSSIPTTQAMGTFMFWRQKCVLIYMTNSGVNSSDVNKDITPKAKDTNLKAKAKATTPKAKAKDSTLKAKIKDVTVEGKNSRIIDNQIVHFTKLALTHCKHICNSTDKSHIS